ncbi:Hypothetical Protein FCC1311_000992 [Hondaea fermentalgiana]|uniref:UDP-galactopyranose mutase C-terminal domain-containing protein n=1 Tax=Hondaea fermentalgiana TaxID=2315210 RepID=A0A2R5FYS6_9STRA|nr:Hypothetical Protein FCC1311_000992 [Hondaea fermentalgiana]|eukprot:GBG23880.1 Hypothetical Protein FCC1311_000992 [Hondaea fermentalgiana]
MHPTPARLHISSSQTSTGFRSWKFGPWKVLALLLGSVVLTWHLRGLTLSSMPCELTGKNPGSLSRRFQSSVSAAANSFSGVEAEETPVAYTPRTQTKASTVIELAAEQFPDVLTMQEMQGYDILIVGAGLSGTVLADLYARKHGKKVLIIERRPHIGGNCYDFHEQRTGILVNLYGAHLFHTGKEDVWKYVHRFSEWTPYEHRVVGRVDGKLVPIPVNIDTVNAILGENVDSVSAMADWLSRERRNSPVGEVDVATAKNSREVGMGRVGERLYNKLFKEYTKKQWNVYPEDLGPVVLSRIPVRQDWDDRYFPNDKHQALPADGYTRWFEEALDHPNIRVFTSTDYFAMLKHEQFAKLKFEKTFFTGQIDQFFRNRGVNLKPLQYRSIKFETVVVPEPSVHQPAFVVNFPQFRDGNHTRTAEYKHMYHQDSAQSVLIREYSTDIKDGAEPYYPFPTEENQQHFEKYRELAKDEEEVNNVHFVGRLANYKYFNMDDAIQNALDLYVKLEGRSRLDAALAEAKIPSEDDMDVHYVVALRKGMSDFSWIGDLCASPTWKHAGGASRVRNTLFFYNMDRNLDNSLLATLRSALSKAGCGHDTRLGKGIIVRNIAQTASIELVWLEHLSAHSFAFGDVNVFLDALVASEMIPSLSSALDLQAKHLFQKQRSRASQPRVFSQNIRAVPRPSGDSSWVVSDEFSKIDAQSSRAGLLHVLPLGSSGLNFAPQSIHGQAAESSKVMRMLFGETGAPERCPRMPTSAFTATDAILRRMLTVHRTKIYDHFIPSLRERPTGLSAQIMRSYWYCLFFSFV